MPKIIQTSHTKAVIPTQSDTVENVKLWEEISYDDWGGMFARHTNDGPPPDMEVDFCHYVNNKIVQTKRQLKDTKYIAISHVWGDVVKTGIPEVDWKQVMLSHEKARFLSSNGQLHKIVEDTYFWMDVLCVNQDDDQARVSVTQYIPVIFKYAMRTLVVQPSGGFMFCCALVLEDKYRTEFVGDDPGIHSIFDNHLDRWHHGGKDIRETALERLWLFQEMILSDEIQFVRCERVPGLPRPERQTATVLHSSIGLLEVIRALAFSWQAHGTHFGAFVNREHEYQPFLHAYLNGGTVYRLPVHAAREKFDTVRRELYGIRNDAQTTHARDFILATLPQYPFYRVPANTKAMSFMELYLDLVQQMRGAGQRVFPLFKAEKGVTLTDLINGTAEASPNIPEPVYLGDFLRLLHGPELGPGETKDSDKESVLEASLLPVKIRFPVIGDDPIAALQFLTVCFLRSRTTWYLTYTGRSFAHACLRKDWDKLIDVILEEKKELEVAAVVLITLLPIDERNFTRGDMEDWTAYTVKENLPSLVLSNVFASVDGKERSTTWADILHCLVTSSFWIPSAVRLAAIISCGLGVSTFHWTIKNLEPVSISGSTDGENILGLISSEVAAASAGDSYQFFIGEGKKEVQRRQRFILLARQSDGPADIYTTGLVAENSSFERYDEGNATGME